VENKLNYGNFPIFMSEEFDLEDMLTLENVSREGFTVEDLFKKPQEYVQYGVYVEALIDEILDETGGIFTKPDGSVFVHKEYVAGSPIYKISSPQ
jgi:hypothetical protein